jgi:hypothetical protein
MELIHVRAKPSNQVPVAPQHHRRPGSLTEEQFLARLQGEA